MTSLTMTALHLGEGALLLEMRKLRPRDVTRPRSHIQQVVDPALVDSGYPVPAQGILGPDSSHNPKPLPGLTSCRVVA